KGVMVEHRSLINYLWWVKLYLNEGRKERLPAVTSMTFDACLKQIFGPLLEGDEVWILREQEVNNPELLLGALGRRPQVALNCVPTLWESLLGKAEKHEYGIGIRRLLIGGERLNKELVERTRRAVPGVEIVNLYGPTEATANACTSVVKWDEEVTIGRP